MKATKLSSGRRIADLGVTIAAAVVLSLHSHPASSLTQDCERLRRAIAESSQTRGNGQIQAAIERQRAEIDRTIGYSHQIGCDNRKFLFFGSDPPAQCGQIDSQIGRMRANLSDLQARGGSAGGRGDLIGRFNSQCANQPNRPSGIIDALFGQPKPGELEEQPLAPDGADIEKPAEKSVSPIGEARAGGKAVCVRSCDGAFFPLSYSASGGRLDSLAEMCRALCPNAEVTLYTYPVTGEIEQAVSINGARYMDSPTALRYRRTFDPSCSCRRRGQTWASALAPAETLLGKEDKSDIIVTPEKSVELSRPKVEGKAKIPKGNKSVVGATGIDANPGTPQPSGLPASDGGRTDANGVDMALKDAAAAMSREGSGIGAGAEISKSGSLAADQGKVFDETAPDGGRRKVRVVGQ